MATAVYFLCALASAVCAAALIREYLLRHTRLLLWSSLSFICFAISNCLVFTDFVVLPARDLSFARGATAALAVVLLLYGFIFETE